MYKQDVLHRHCMLLCCIATVGVEDVERCMYAQLGESNENLVSEYAIWHPNISRYAQRDDCK